MCKKKEQKPGRREGNYSESKKASCKFNKADSLPFCAKKGAKPDKEEPLRSEQKNKNN